MCYNYSFTDSSLCDFLSVTKLGKYEASLRVASITKPRQLLFYCRARIQVFIWTFDIAECDEDNVALLFFLIGLHFPRSGVKVSGCSASRQENASICTGVVSVNNTRGRYKHYICKPELRPVCPPRSDLVAVSELRPICTACSDSLAVVPLEKVPNIMLDVSIVPLVRYCNDDVYRKTVMRAQTQLIKDKHTQNVAHETERNRQGELLQRRFKVQIA